MKKTKAQKLTLLATSIAFEIIKDKNQEELCDLKFVISQISSTINNYIGLLK